MASSSDSRSLLSVAVVERQLIMQGLDLKSLSRLARSCRQLSAESLHPSAGRYLPGAGPSVTSSPFILKAIDPDSMDHPSHQSSLVRQHVPFQLRLDNMAALQSAEATESLAHLLVKLATIKKLDSLSVWGSPDSWTEEQALSLLAAVHLSCTSIWGVRGDSVWVKEKVQRAIFSMPRLTQGCVQLSTGSSSEAILLAPALTLATRLQSIVLVMSASDLAQTVALSALPNLERLCLYFSSDPDADRQPIVHLRLPHLHALEVVSEDNDGVRVTALNPEQLHALLVGLPELRTLEFQDVMPLQATVETCLNVGPTHLPALRELLLLGQRDDFGSESDCVQRCLVAWPDLDLVVTYHSSLKTMLRDSGLFTLSPRGAELSSSAELGDRNRQLSVKLKEKAAANEGAIGAR